MLQVFKGFWITPVSQISGQYTQRGIGMVMIYIFDTPVEVGLWVATVEGFAHWYKMRVSKVNQFHAGAVPLD